MDQHGSKYHSHTIYIHTAYFDNSSRNSLAFCQMLAVIVVVEVCHEKQDILNVLPTSIETGTKDINYYKVL